MMKILFAKKNNFSWNNANRDELKFINLCKDETNTLVTNPFLNDDEHDKTKNYIIHPKRISELRRVKSEKFDLTKLIQLCIEVNKASESLIAISLIKRAIIDHIPPIFGFSNFSQLANNYSGTKSFKKSMLKLDISLRNIADNNLHAQVRNKEVLPTPAQVDFKQEIDLLLSEIVRVLK